MQMVVRVRLSLRARRPPPVALPHTTALILYDAASAPTPPAVPSGTATSSARYSGGCTAALSLEKRTAEPHECADGRTREGSEADVRIWGQVRILLSDGLMIRAAASPLAQHSLMLRTLLLSSGTFRESTSEACGEAQWDMRMDTFEPAAVRGAVCWMQAADGAEKREAADQLLTPELVIAAARCSQYVCKYSNPESWCTSCSR